MTNPDNPTDATTVTHSTIGAKPAQQNEYADLVEQAQALARGMMFARRVHADAEDLSDVYLFLTNDIRALVEFDRAFLIVYLGGRPKCVAAHGQPSVEKKSKLVRQVNELGGKLKGLQQTLVLSEKQDVTKLEVKGLDSRAKESLKSYLTASRCSCLAAVPLQHERSNIALLVLEFFGDRVPDKLSITSLANFAPFLAAVLAEKWILNKKPSVARLIDPERKSRSRGLRLAKYAGLSALLVVLLIYVLFFIPVPFTVGGEAEIVPKEKHVAFCNIDGIVEKVHVAEGAHVEKGQVLATLDPTDLDFKIGSIRRELEILSQEIQILKASVEEDPSKLAESELVELKKQNKQRELEYLQSKRGFLEIKAPVAGLVLTKEVQTLTGKSFKAGEPFCEIAFPGELCADVWVREDRIGYVTVGQTASVYLNNNPGKAYGLSIEGIAPRAEASQRLGNVYRVRCPFPDAPAFVKAGMKGVGKLDCGNTSIWFVIEQRLAVQCNKLVLCF